MMISAPPRLRWWFSLLLLVVDLWPVLLVLLAIVGLASWAARLTPAQQHNDLAELQLLEDCQAACDPLGPELVAGACYCRADLVAP